MADWRMARSLEQLRTQLNELAPNRSKASDGGIGDAAHAKTASDHNPRHFNWADRPLVLARDFTHDPVGGLDCQRLYTALVEARDPRIKYIIWRRHITAGTGGPMPWSPRSYAGTNPHDKHLHLSVIADPRADLATSWTVRLNTAAPWRRWPTIRRGDTGDAVKTVQRWLGIVEADEPGYGVFGPRTEKRVREYQAMRGIAADGVVGARTWAEIGL